MFVGQHGVRQRQATSVAPEVARRRERDEGDNRPVQLFEPVAHGDGVFLTGESGEVPVEDQHDGGPAVVRQSPSGAGGVRQVDVGGSVPDAHGHGQRTSPRAPDRTMHPVFHPHGRCQTHHVSDFEAFEAAGWEERAHAYHHFFTPVTGQLAGALLDAAGVGAGCRVLDVGSGAGVVAGAAAARGAAVVGLDGSEQMVALARRTYPGVQFRRGDAHQLPFPDGSFDAAVGNFVVLHLGRPEHAAAELLRVLVPGGRTALSTWDAPERGRLPGLFAEAVAAAGASPPSGVPDGPPFFRFSVDDVFTALLTGAGFTDVSVNAHSFVHRVPSPDDLWHGVLEGTVRTRATVLGLP
jgi:SAM-dependent methyltransferase